jgi:hypothetical protein
METLILGIVGFLCLWIYVSFNWYGWKTNLEIWQLKSGKKSKITRSKRYKSVDEMWEDLDKKDVWYKELWLTIRIRIEQFFDIPRDIYRYFKRGMQRWNRCWSDEDVWGVNDFLSKVIPAMLKRLKETQHGLPTWTEEKTEEQAQKEWDEILDSIIETFETSKKIADNELAYFEKWTQKKADKYNKIWIDWKYEPKPRAMTKEECLRYKKGWFYLQKFFYSLWD